MTAWFRRIPLFMACGILIWFLCDPIQVRETVSDALALCAGNVIPALFPFLSVTGLLISLGLGEYAAPLFTPWMTPLFHLPGSAGNALLLGFLGGYPSGARTAAELYRRGQLTRTEAQRLLTFCNNSNPAFFISVLGGGVFGNVHTGIWLLLIHIASALLTGMLFCNAGGLFRNSAGRVSRNTGFHGMRSESGADRNRTFPRREADTFHETFHRESDTLHEAFRSPSAPVNFFPAFVESIGNAAESMMKICAFVIFFYTLASPLRKWDSPAGVICTGFLELFSLTPLLTRNAFSLTVAAGLSGWGGVCVLCQTGAVISDSGLSIRYCAAGKLVQGLLSAFLTAFLLALKVIPVPV